MNKEGLQVTFEAEGEELVATLTGEVDHHTAAPVRERIDTALFKHRPRRLTIDLGGVDFMDSSGLGLILGRAALCEEMGAALRLRHPGARVKKIFAVAGLDRLSHIETEE